MTSSTENWSALPRDLMELQLGQIDLLMAMYASDEAVTLDTGCEDLIENLRTWCASLEDALPPLKPDDTSVGLRLTLDIEEEEEAGDPKIMQLDLTFPLTYEGQIPTEPPHVRVRILQPAWMSKADVARLSLDIPDEDVLTAIEYVKEVAAQHLMSSNQSSADLGLQQEERSIVRAWFYFPSISTRSKRDDLINYAPIYGLTGFLLAGKPGVLCLEGNAQSIDDYMKFIKTESWGDIPPQHKKVSERYREAGPDLKRAFVDMQEITDTVGERRGERANRNDMKALEAWLSERYLGDAFTKVLI